MIFDESVVQRRLLSEIIAEIPGAEAVAAAATGNITLAKLGQAPVDLLLFDVDMASGSPMELMKKIRDNYPDTGLVTLSAPDSARPDLAIQALEMGALDLLTKPEPSRGEAGKVDFKIQFEPILRAFRGKKHVQLAKRLAKGVGSRQDHAPAGGAPSEGAAPKAPSKPAVDPTFRPDPLVRGIDVVAMGISTGGPNALAELIPGLPGNLGVPILLVQHMPTAFTTALAASLDRKSALTVREGVEGMEVKPNFVYIAPGGKHMVIRSGKNGLQIGLTSSPPVNSCRPSVDVLFDSIARSVNGGSLAVVMTGMGNDGVEGVRRMKTKGCYCLSQSEETCVVYGMPRAVDEAGLSDERVPLGQLASRITALVRKNGCCAGK